MTMPLSKAIKEWEAKNSAQASEAKDLALYGGMVLDGKRVFINKLDASLATLKECQKLSLSTNMIDRIAPLTGMDKLRVLSLARNNIKKFERLDDVAATLEELWCSYNQVSSLDGLQACSKLRILYLSNNALRDWAELDKLAGLPELTEVLFVGNPIYDSLADKGQAILQVLKRLPRLTKVDSILVTDQHREAAKAV